MNLLQRLLESPEGLARIKRWSIACLILIAAADVFLPLVFDGGHHYFSFEGLPGWGSLYGLISCAAIIVVSKLIGKVWLMRREDYYDS